jgi:hypothetical protein
MAASQFCSFGFPGEWVTTTRQWPLPIRPAHLDEIVDEGLCVAVVLFVLRFHHLGKFSLRSSGDLVQVARIRNRLVGRRLCEAALHSKHLPQIPFPASTAWMRSWPLGRTRARRVPDDV